MKRVVRGHEYSVCRMEWHGTLGIEGEGEPRVIKVKAKGRAVKEAGSSLMQKDCGFNVLSSVRNTDRVPHDPPTACGWLARPALSTVNGLHHIHGFE